MTTSGTGGEPTVRARPVPAAAVLAVAGTWVVAARLVGTWDGVGRLSLGAAPLIGRWDPGVPVRTVAPVVLGGAAVWLLPLAAERARWWWALGVSWAGSAVLALVLAAVDGREAVAEPLETGYEYRAILGHVDRIGVGEFVRGFVDRLPEYPTHVRGHPVGAPLVFWAQEQLGLRGGEWSALLVVAIGTSVVVSVGVALREVAGDAIARRALPFLAVTPSLVWVATSFDALVAGVVGAAVALVVVAAHRDGVWSDVAAGLGGAVGALALHVSYGAVLMLLPAAVVVVHRRRVRPLAVASVGAVLVTAAFVAGGFWWFDGLSATRAEYVLGAGGYRPFWYFALLGNPAALLLALGPAAAVALARLRDPRVWVLAGGALAAVVIADLSGMSKGEVERIWLPFVPWLAVATVVFGSRRRWWLGAQMASAVALQVTLVSPW